MGSVTGHGRKIIAINCYLPPNLAVAVAEAEECMCCIAGAVVDLKKHYSSPFILIAGDFNQWRVEDHLDEFCDIAEILTGPTRNGRSIDRFFSNFGRSVVEAGTWAPLETDEDEQGDSVKSDHAVAHCGISLKKTVTFKWQEYSYRQYTGQAVKNFKDWIVMHPWDEVLGAHRSNNKAVAYQNTLKLAIDRFFPLQTTRRKTTDLPWLGKGFFKQIKRRKRLFVAEGCKRTEVWKKEKKRIDELVRGWKRSYMDTQKDNLLAPDAARCFFKNVRNFASYERPKMFDVRELLPSRSDNEAAECLAEYFNAVSEEFDPLSPHQIPQTKSRPLPVLENFEVTGRIKR